MSDSVWPYGQQPTSLLCPRKSLGRSTGMGCHFLLHKWNRVLTIFLLLNNLHLLILQCYFCIFGYFSGFPGGSDSKESTCNAGDTGSFSGSGKSSGEGNGNPLQYSCLKNSTDRGTWWAIVHGVTERPHMASPENFTIVFLLLV